MSKNSNHKDKRSQTRIEEPRVDTYSRDWEERTRIDLPPRPDNLPLPESPLVTLKPHNRIAERANQGPDENGGKSEG